MLKPIQLLTPIFFSIILLAACNQNTSSTMPNAAYPGPGYPGPRDTSPSVTSTLGAIKANFSYADNGRPIRRQIFYAAKLLPFGNTPDAYLPSLDASTAPQGESDESGNTWINLIQPGRYALALMTPRGPILVMDAGNEKEIIFEVSAGQVTDLGNKTILINSSLLEP